MHRAVDIVSAEWLVNITNLALVIQILLSWMSNMYCLVSLTVLLGHKEEHLVYEI